MQIKTRALLITLLFCLLLSSGYTQSLLKTGIWRGVLTTSTGNAIPFNFEVSIIKGHRQLAIINGAERFKVTAITGRGDSVFIQMPLFDSQFRLKLIGGNLVGKWIKNLGDHYAVMGFKATPNTAWRFATPQKPLFNVTGQWLAPINVGAKKNVMTIGEFKQTGPKVTGTFLSTTGDYRYLEGVVTGNTLYLSCFNGGDAYLFTAKVTKQKITGGKFYSGLTAVHNWIAERDAKARLPDAYSLTALKPGYKKIAFSFRDINGHKVSLTDNRFKNKVVIVQILGSWCPNCMDETAYLVNYYKKYHVKGVEIVGLAYELTPNFAGSQRALRQLINRFNIPYTLLITGYTPVNNGPAKSLPMLAKVLGFPTTIIIDKKGDVRKIHTGFSGPGTGVYYAQFKSEFEKLTDKLLAEK